MGNTKNLWCYFWCHVEHQFFLVLRLVSCWTPNFLWCYFWCHVEHQKFLVLFLVLCGVGVIWCYLVSFGIITPCYCPSLLSDEIRDYLSVLFHQILELLYDQAWISDRARESNTTRLH